MIPKGSQNPNPLSRDASGITMETGRAQAASEVISATQAGQAQPLLQMAMNLAKPLQLVFSIRKRTQQARSRIQELQDRVDSLEASIETAKGQSHMGQRLDKLR
ncbi:MAG: hypothetical protein VKJ04_06095 [Vampirovibrionales bacterium]|nr:hypothetical protein [Vampirovibrionales bacterium]